jgi:lipoxygenase
MRRNMSSMHPIHKLLAPHFRGVLATNSVARESLVGPEGVLSSMLPPGR